MNNRFAAAWWMLLWVFVSTTASAAPINVRFCATWGTSFADDGGTDDYYTVSLPTTALGSGFTGYGAMVHVWNNGILRYNDYTPESGAGGIVGCTTLLTIERTASTSVTVFPMAEVGGNTIVVSGGATSTFNFAANTLNNNDSKTMTTSASTTWNTMAAATWAMTRRTGGVSGETFTFHHGNCPAGSYPCFNPPDEKIYLTTNGGFYKYIIVHEMGHALAYYAAGHTGPLVPFGVDFYGRNNTHLGCQSSSGGGHSIDSDEYQAAAFTEGIAHFYSSVAFNSTADSDCFRAQHYNVDWNDDGINENAWYSCQGAEPGGTNSADFWWWGSDGSSTTLTCNDPGENYNLGTEYDWTRFLWDLHKNQSLSSGDIFDIYANATPANWYVNGSPPGFNFFFYPSYELWASAVSLGFQTKWENEWHNGPLR